MLKTLTVWNFALLEQVEIEFDSGLNILTGETGAGKSILIDALGAVLGHRLSGDVIRTGCDWLRVEAIFDIAGEDKLHSFLREQAIEDEDDTLIVTRQLTIKGKNVILVNGCHVTLNALKKIGEYLVDIHGQNENLALLKAENQYHLLDGSRPESTRLAEAYGAAFAAWQEAAAALKTKEEQARGLADRLDMLRWQVQEIESAQLTEREDEGLEVEIKRLSNAERITESIEEARALLDGDDNHDGTLGALARVKAALETAARYDEGVAVALPLLEDAACQMEEVAHIVRGYGDGLEFDPARLDALQSRLDTIDKLCRKYGGSLAAVIAHQEKITAELADIENYDSDIERLHAAESEAKKAAQAAAEALRQSRKEAAADLSSQISERLGMLGMPDARLTLKLSPTELTARGADDLDILFLANAGEGEKPLAKIASGGELSRIALAMKSVAAAGDSSVGSMVFDEIDTGIGGKTAQMVAECIASVAIHKQVLCITHLPQIACMADGHYYLSKVSAKGKTTTTIRRLKEAEQVKEIARMASGMDVSAASLDNAREMIRFAAAKKKELRSGKKRR
ncbi:MAG: DNA repair protein RecN [Schwartzia sp. (in: firmicutes)]